LISILSTISATTSTWDLATAKGNIEIGCHIMAAFGSGKAIAQCYHVTCRAAPIWDRGCQTMVHLLKLNALI